MLIHGDDEDVQKVEEINDTSSNGLSGEWSHDQFPKMVKKRKVVALHCSFLDMFKLCSHCGDM